MLPENQCVNWATDASFFSIGEPLLLTFSLNCIDFIRKEVNWGKDNTAHEFQYLATYKSENCVGFQHLVQKPGDGDQYCKGISAYCDENEPNKLVNCGWESVMGTNNSLLRS